MIKVVMIFIAALGVACANTAPDMTAYDGQETREPVITREAEDQESADNECKICDFDFRNYKGELGREEIDGLLLALNDEYLAIATYQTINRQFGDPRPFVNIVRAEERHAAQLINVFKNYDIGVPENPWIETAPKFESVGEACKAGVEGEVINIKLYDRLLNSTSREDILAVYQNLQRASEDKHKPAFERCVSGGGRGMERGQGRNY